MNRNFAFTRMGTSTIAQASTEISLNKIIRKIFPQIQLIMEEGIILWNGEQIINAKGEISIVIADDEDKQPLCRKRNSNRKSRCDGILWYGYADGVSWPVGVNSLLQVHCIINGVYLLRIWQHLHHTLSKPPRKCWDKPTERYGKAISLTKSSQDIWDEYPIDTSIKVTTEPNHVTFLGFLKDIFKIEWKNFHKIQGFNEYHSRLYMRCYLVNNFHLINGNKSFLINIEKNLHSFSQMHHTWQMMIELMLSLTVTFDWFGNLQILIALIRFTGSIFCCNSRNRLQKLQDICVSIFQSGI
jgi:hypothetical protein